MAGLGRAGVDIYMERLGGNVYMELLIANSCTLSLQLNISEGAISALTRWLMRVGTVYGCHTCTS